METKSDQTESVSSPQQRRLVRLHARGMTRAPVVRARVYSLWNCLAVWAVLLIGAPVQAAPAIISAGKPVTITTNGAWEAGGYSPSNVTDGLLSCVDLASSSEVGTVGWQNNDYNELGVVNVTIDLGNAYTISSIDYNMGDCMRASTWGADSITTPLGTFSPSPGAGSTGVWSSQAAVDQVVASTVTMQLSKTRTTWDTDWMSIGEIRIWGELVLLPELGPEAGPEPGPEAESEPGPEAGPEPGPEPGPESGPEPGPEPTPEPPRDAGVYVVPDSAQAAPEIVSAGKPVTITTNGAWEAGGYFPADVTDGDLSCVDLATSSLDGTVGWQNNDYNELGVVNVTIDLGNVYTISSIDYNMGDCMRANTWGADSITTPLGTFYPSPGVGSTGTWSSQTATGQVIASTITIQLSKTRTAWDQDWMSIGEIRVWGELAQLPEPGPEPTPEPPRDAGVDAPADSGQDGSVTTATGTDTNTVTLTATTTSTTTGTTATNTATVTRTATATTGTVTTTGTSVSPEPQPDAAPPIAVADAATPDVISVFAIGVDASVSDGAVADTMAGAVDMAVITPASDATISAVPDGGIMLADAATGTARDAGVFGRDGGQTRSQDGAGNDGAATTSKASGGCGCVVGGGNTDPAGFWPLLVLGFLVLWRGIRPGRRKADRV